MKTIITIVIVIAVVAGGYFYFTHTKTAQAPTQTPSNNSGNPDNQAQPNPQPNQPSTPTNTGETTSQNSVATIETNLGSFQVTLDAKAAPKTVANFVKLAKQGFYNNLTFHRVVRDFIIQGGDPKGDGTGGPGYTVPAEIGLQHKVGAIAMARSPDSVNPTKASNGSQFYIALQDLAQLDGQYTVFGHVSLGMSVVTKIAATPTEPNPMTGEVSSPLTPVIINKITISK